MTRTRSEPFPSLLLTGRAYPEPSRVSLGVPLRCLQVSCGRKHALALMEGGFVTSWGEREGGDLQGEGRREVLSRRQRERRGVCPPSKALETQPCNSHTLITVCDRRGVLWAARARGQSVQRQASAHPPPGPPPTGRRPRGGGGLRGPALGSAHGRAVRLLLRLQSLRPGGTRPGVQQDLHPAARKYEWDR